MPREIEVIVEGTITEEIIERFNERLAIALIAKLGRDGAEYLVQELEKKEME